MAITPQKKSPGDTVKAGQTSSTVFRLRQSGRVEAQHG